MAQRLRTIAAPIAAGVLSCGVAGMLLSMMMDRGTPASEPRQEPLAPANDGPSSAAQPRDSTRVSPAKQQALATAEVLAAMRQEQLSPASNRDPGVKQGSPPNFEVYKQRELEEWESRLAAFSQEPVDSAWATRAAAEFEADVAALEADQGFVFVGAECRSTSCAAKVRFPSYDDAVVGFQTLLHHDYSMRCGRAITLPEPPRSEHQQSYEATILFNCAASRTGRDGV